jgi:hypothetical protein
VIGGSRWQVVGLVAVTHAIAGGLIWYKNKVRRK